MGVGTYCLCEGRSINFNWSLILAFNKPSIVIISFHCYPTPCFWLVGFFLFRLVCFVFLDRTTFKDIRQCILRIQNSISSYLTRHHVTVNGKQLLSTNMRHNFLSQHECQEERSHKIATDWWTNDAPNVKISLFKNLYATVKWSVFKPVSLNKLSGDFTLRRFYASPSSRDLVVGQEPITLWRQKTPRTASKHGELLS